jgi:hypothetical protein
MEWFSRKSRSNGAVVMGCHSITTSSAPAKPPLSDERDTGMRALQDLRRELFAKRAIEPAARKRACLNRY